VAEVRHILNRSNGTFAEAGAVGWQFTRNSYFAFPLGKHDPDKIFELAVEAGADDVTFDDDVVEMFGPVEVFKSLSVALQSNDIHPEEAELRMIPNQEMELDDDEAIQVMRVIDALEELDDVANVYSNLSISESVMAKLDEA
jgi:transcriptional/translational regulatory protein YebC/TACO1